MGLTLVEIFHKKDIFDKFKSGYLTQSQCEEKIKKLVTNVKNKYEEVK